MVCYLVWSFLFYFTNPYFSDAPQDQPTLINELKLDYFLYKFASSQSNMMYWLFFSLYVHFLLSLHCLALTQYCVDFRFFLCALSVFYMLSTKDREYNIFIMLLVVLYDLRAKIVIFECLWDFKVCKTPFSHQMNYAFVFSWQP